jgi:2-polyprenyl-3-methyl-5-hydroxy-6-metoxy-1,4-benzoquinol methylase
MDDLDLLIELHRDAKRQGPGGVDETRLSAKLSGLGGSEGMKIADIGCGTGASTLVLARVSEPAQSADIGLGFVLRRRRFVRPY